MQRAAATAAMLLFVATPKRWFLTRCSWPETLALLIAFTLFWPGFRIDVIAPPYAEWLVAGILEAARNLPRAGQPGCASPARQV